MNPDAAEIDYRVLNYNVSVRIVHTARAIQTEHAKMKCISVVTQAWKNEQ